MKVWLASSFLPLLLLTWLPTGLTQQISATIDVSLQLDLVLQCLLQAGSGSTAGEVKWLNTTQNNGEKPNEGDVEKSSAQLVFTGVNATHAGTYTCTMKNPRSVPSKNKTVKKPEESVRTVECRFKIWLENTTVHVEWNKIAFLEVGNQTNTTALRENWTNLTRHSMQTADMGICGCSVFITRINLTDTGNSTQGTGPNFPGAPQTNVTEKEIWSGLNFLLCIVFGLAVGTLLYVPIIGFLLWHCRRNRKGKLTSRQIAEGNQLSTAVPVTGTEDLTYANLKFEKKSGTKPTASDVVYTEIKPSQQK